MSKTEYLSPYENPEDESLAVKTFLESVDAEPEILYAFDKTGIVVTDQNKDKLSKEDLKSWNEAIAEFYNPN